MFCQFLPYCTVTQYIETVYPCVYIYIIHKYIYVPIILIMFHCK